MPSTSHFENTTASRASRAIERRVLRYVTSQGLIAHGETVVAGVSGGADSTALLLLLTRLAPKLDISVRAAHFDHQLRGKKTSKEERQTVESLCGALGVPLTTGAGDVRAFAREKRLGIEEAARELRYAFLARAAHDTGARSVAVGHTADDQVETVLMHVLRGSGLTGLAGMLPRSSWPVATERGRDLALVRPLLETRRSETEAYCREMGREPLEDATNRLARYKRNVVRNELLPLLRAHVPGVDASLLRLAKAAASERQALEAAAARELETAATFEDGAVRMSIASLRRAPAGLLPQIMRLGATRLLGDARDLGERHLRAMSAAVEKPAGTELDLPRGLHLRVEYDEIVLTPREVETKVASLPLGGIELAVPGSTTAGNWQIEASLLDGEARLPVGMAPLPDGAWEAKLDADALAGSLSVRRRRAGDRFRPLGMEGEKKLQDIFVDAKVRRSDRDNVPVVCDSAGIVWVAGYRPAERVKVTPSTRRILHLLAKRCDCGDRGREP
jgi:tRNA(Ile)-lysidine synthase